MTCTRYPHAETSAGNEAPTAPGGNSNHPHQHRFEEDGRTGLRARFRRYYEELRYSLRRSLLQRHSSPREKLSGDNQRCSCNAGNYIFLPALLLSSETRDWPAGVGLSELSSTIARALIAFPYRRWLASLSGSSEAPSSDTPAKTPEVRE